MTMLQATARRGFVRLSPALHKAAPAPPLAHGEEILAASLHALREAAELGIDLGLDLTPQVLSPGRAQIPA